MRAERAPAVINVTLTEDEARELMAELFGGLLFRDNPRADALYYSLESVIPR